VFNPTHGPLPDNKRHSQKANIHAPGGIRTHNLSKRVTLDRAATAIGGKYVTVFN